MLQKGDSGLLGPPPVVFHPESIAAQAAYTEARLPGSAPPELFAGIGVLPGPDDDDPFIVLTETKFKLQSPILVTARVTTTVTVTCP